MKTLSYLLFFFCSIGAAFGIDVHKVSMEKIKKQAKIWDLSVVYTEIDAGSIRMFIGDSRSSNKRYHEYEGYDLRGNLYWVVYDIESESFTECAPVFTKDEMSAFRRGLYNINVVQNGNNYEIYFTAIPPKEKYSIYKMIFSNKGEIVQPSNKITTIETSLGNLGWIGATSDCMLVTKSRNSDYVGIYWSAIYRYGSGNYYTLYDIENLYLLKNDKVLSSNSSHSEGSIFFSSRQNKNNLFVSDMGNLCLINLPYDIYKGYSPLEAFQITLLNKKDSYARKTDFRQLQNSPFQLHKASGYQVANDSILVTGMLLRNNESAGLYWTYIDMNDDDISLSVNEVLYDEELTRGLERKQFTRNDQEGYVAGIFPFTYEFSMESEMVFSSMQTLFYDPDKHSSKLLTTSSNDIKRDVLYIITCTADGRQWMKTINLNTYPYTVYGDKYASYAVRNKADTILVMYTELKPEAGVKSISSMEPGSRSYTSYILFITDEIQKTEQFYADGEPCRIYFDRNKILFNEGMVFWGVQKDEKGKSHLIYGKSP